MKFVLPIIPDTFEKVQGLPQSVCVIIFPYYHVVAAASHNEDDSCNIWAEHTKERKKERKEREQNISVIPGHTPQGNIVITQQSAKNTKKKVICNTGLLCQ